VQNKKAIVKKEKALGISADDREPGPNDTVPNEPCDEEELPEDDIAHARPSEGDLVTMKYWYNNGRTVSAYGVIVGKSYDHPEALKVIVKKVAKGSDNLKWRRGPAETVEDALNSEVVVEWPSDFLEKLSSEEYTSIEMPSAIRNAVANRPATSDLMKGKHVVHKRKNINIEQENDSEAQTLSKGAPVILKIWTGRSNVVFGKGIMIEDVMGDICKVLVQSVKKDMPLVGNLLEMNPGMAKTRDLEHREVEWEKELIEVEDLKKKKKKRKD